MQVLTILDKSAIINKIAKKGAFMNKEEYKRLKISVLYFDETDVICSSQFIENDSNDDLEWDWYEGGIL